ncbi:putative heat shock protein 75 [Besnoitia besnoiti]|uniref:Putative heat shock protein 75 n=1 Tax=Besnoitia besnoiti TaxID=94643 RepID=A0A2A9MR29_BESBE|nr:putative heat shock protein 75 [Besnoitia besnoiti]PFH38800.1 putative heat shock protein 75 [Besnoitia besnoiti]
MRRSSVNQLLLRSAKTTVRGKTTLPIVPALKESEKNVSERSPCSVLSFQRTGADLLRPREPNTGAYRSVAASCVPSATELLLNFSQRESSVSPSGNVCPVSSTPLAFSVRLQHLSRALACRGWRHFSTASYADEQTAGSTAEVNAEADHKREVSLGGKGEVHAFKAETKKLLHIVTHSLYTDKEVFIRELISNAADALEKLRFLQATAQVGGSLENESVPLEIRLGTDAAAKTFTLQDTGVGMTKEELLEHLGTIAKSGSLEFLMKHQGQKNADIIGQFGVGFYSSFVVSDRVDVYTRAHAEGAKAYLWSSDGTGEFSIKELSAEEAASAGLKRGTKIVCHLKNDCAEFANTNHVKECATRFSSFVNFPIFVTEADGTETKITAQQALWLQTAATDDEHRQFFRYLSNTSWGDPKYHIMFRTDAPLSIKALFYIPEDPPSRLFQPANEVGVSLHSRRVLVKKSATEIIPKWLGFLKGVIDCDDIPLNVSRENMQNSILIEKLSQILVRRVLKFLDDQSRSDPEKYLDFYRKYAQHLKEGVLDDAHHGSKYKDNLLKLLRFQTSETAAGELISLDKYLEMVKPGQQNIYFYCCPARETAMASPYMEQFKEWKRPVLLMMDDIDEFVAMNVQSYKDKRFVAIDAPEEDFEPLLEEGKEETKEKKVDTPGLVGEHRVELEKFIRGTLGERVSSVKFSDRLVKTPAVVTGFLSSTLRKMMKATLQGAPDAQLKMASLPVTLELNPHHQIVISLYHLQRSNSDVAKMLVEQLYDNACIAAGIMEDPRCMLERLNHLLEVTAQYAYHHKESAAPAEEATSSSADNAASGSVAEEKTPQALSASASLES